MSAAYASYRHTVVGRQQIHWTAITAAPSDVADVGAAATATAALATQLGNRTSYAGKARGRKIFEIFSSTPTNHNKPIERRMTPKWVAILKA